MKRKQPHPTRFRSGAMPPRRGYKQRPEFLAELGAMAVLDVLVWDFMTSAAFHAAIRGQPRLDGMRFRSFHDLYRGQRKLFVVRVH